ncbi:MAG: ATP-dependent helicase [Planctomyces sp.]|nr:ATP-dependent helicase [Planctomyces sp.]MBA4120275.1 ATP-dependent helicase [Isosphaera sp.]
MRADGAPPPLRRQRVAMSPDKLPPRALEIFELDKPFATMGLSDGVTAGLTDMGFVHPTRIQAMLIPPVLAGRDVIGQAKTGTGKTAAFGIPILSRAHKGTPFQALVLVPTRELCIQVAHELEDMARHTGLVVTPVFGGERIDQQVARLRRGAEIVVSTPGRLMDMVGRGHLHLNNVRYAVLDEVDRMLDIGFRDDIRQILGQCPPPGQRQTVFVSATISSDVERLARSHSKDAEKVVAVTKGALTTALVRQHYLPVEPWDKRRLLAHLLTHEDPALTVIFCRTKRTVDELARYLAERHQIDAHAIHGDMYQSKRNKVIERLHKGDLSVLVASDLAARGLDVEGISHVINYDMPEDPEVYVHRIGRTARIGREGVAWSLVTPEQGDLLTQIERLINQEIPKLDYDDFKPTPPPHGRESAPRNRGQGTVAVEGVAGAAAARLAASAAPPIPAPSKASPTEHGKFPGGLVPTKLPPKRMFGKIKSGPAR